MREYLHGQISCSRLSFHIQSPVTGSLLFYSTSQDPSIHTTPFTPLTKFSSGLPRDIHALQVPFTQFITDVRNLQSLFNFFFILLSAPLSPHSLWQKKAWILSLVLHKPLFFCCTSLAVGCTHTHWRRLFFSQAHTLLPLADNCSNTSLDGKRSREGLSLNPACT